MYKFRMIDYLFHRSLLASVDFIVPAFDNIKMTGEIEGTASVTCMSHYSTADLFLDVTLPMSFLNRSPLDRVAHTL